MQLDARVISVREEWTGLERRVFYTALTRATGKDFGQDAAAWKKWFDAEGRVEAFRRRYGTRGVAG